MSEYNEYEGILIKIDLGNGKETPHFLSKGYHIISVQKKSDLKSGKKLLPTKKGKVFKVETKDFIVSIFSEKR